MNVLHIACGFFFWNGTIKCRKDEINGSSHPPTSDIKTNEAGLGLRLFLILYIWVGLFFLSNFLYLVKTFNAHSEKHQHTNSICPIGSDSTRYNIKPFFSLTLTFQFICVDPPPSPLCIVFTPADRHRSLPKEDPLQVLSGAQIVWR